LRGKNKGDRQGRPARRTLTSPNVILISEKENKPNRQSHKNIGYEDAYTSDYLFRLKKYSFSKKITFGINDYITRRKKFQ